jgi:hypothetical protein
MVLAVDEEHQLEYLICRRILWIRVQISLMTTVGMSQQFYDSLGVVHWRKGQYSGGSVLVGSGTSI